MYGENRMQDAAQALRAWTTNQIARLAPSAYLRLTRQTGRGDPALETPLGVARYFEKCFFEYFEILEIARPDIEVFLRGKTVLEYGPGDIPALGILMLAHGAHRVVCVDRFPMFSRSRSAAVLDIVRKRLPAPVRARADAARLEYRVRPGGRSGLRGEVDLVLSRAVLEHVDDLVATFADMAAALRPGGVAVHLIDLRSHGMHRRNPLDFLTWPQTLWRLMHSHKGVPNRWRLPHYRRLIAESGLTVRRLCTTARAEQRDIDAVRPHLAAPFRNIPDEELACLGFWLVCDK